MHAFITFYNTLHLLVLGYKLHCDLQVTTFLMVDIWSPRSKGSTGVLMMHAGLLPWLNGTCGGTKPPVLSPSQKKKLL